MLVKHYGTNAASICHTTRGFGILHHLYTAAMPCGEVLTSEEQGVLFGRGKYNVFLDPGQLQVLNKDFPQI